MPRNGTGTYNLPAGNPVVTGTTISSTWANNTFNDVGSALTQSLSKDGQTTATANLPMGGFRLTNVGIATAGNEYITATQNQGEYGIYIGTVGGTADVITLTASPAITAYAAGQRFTFVASGANTTNVTVNVSSLGAKALTKFGSVALVANDIPSGSIVTMIYDGTRFQVEKIDFRTAAVAYTGNNTHAGTETFTGAVTVQNYINYAATTGTDTYAATLSPAITAYVTGAHYFISFGNANTVTTPTLNLNSIGAKTIKKDGSSALAVGDIPASHKTVLVYDGTDLILLNPRVQVTASTGSSLVLIDSQAASNSATLDFTGIDTTYDEILFVVVDLIPASAQTLYMRVGTGAGPTYQSGAGDYVYRGRGLDVGGGSVRDFGATAGQIALSSSAIPMATTTGASSAGWSGEIRAFALGGSTNSKAIQFVGGYRIDSGSVSDYTFFDGRGYYQAATAVTAIRFLMSSGNITSGTIYRYGVKKS